MKEPNENIRKLFSDFEPEVSSDKLEESWEKMTYFLPREKKRRFAFYLPGCAALLCLLLGGLISYFILHSQNITKASTTQTKTKIVPEALPIQPSVHLKKKQSTTRSYSVGANDINSIPGQKHVHTSVALKNESPVQHPHPAKETNITVNTHPNGVAAPPLKNITPVKQEQAFHQAGNLVQTKNNKEDDVPAFPTHTIEYGIEIQTRGHEPTPFVYLPPYLPSTAQADTSLETPLVAIPRPMGSFIHPGFRVQVFGGPAFVFSTVNDQLYDIKNQNNTMNASVGAALSYQFLNKVSVMGQCVVSQSKLNYLQTSTQSMDVTNYAIISSSPGPKQYVDLFTTRTLRSSLGYNVALGMGYAIYHRGRIGMTAFALLNLRQVKYSYSEAQIQGTDTLSVPSTGTSFLPPPPTLSGFTALPVKTSAVVKTTGLITGLVIDYKLNRNFAIIFRPSYYLQLPTNNARFNDQFRIKQNVFYFDFGIQVKR